MTKHTDVKGSWKNNGSIKIENHVFSGALWFAGWLFTIGFLDLSFWRGVLGIVIWPFYLGEYIARLIS
ncbi:MAG: hypothetical protein Q8P33_00590 [bacterium]|nr:hypothetical protein [bacterium]